MSDSATGASNVGAILDAYLRALEEGHAPPREELLAQHPQCAAELAAALDGLEFIHLASREIPRGVKEGDALAERQLLGDFRLVREVGRGGMAVVYEAEQVSLGRRVALKVLPFAAVLDPKQLQRFKNEALSAAHLRHPHIVPVYSVGCERGVHYYAMQLIEGQSLATVIREMRGEAPAPATASKTPITSHGSNREPGYVRMAVALGMQAAEALDHAHQLGIVHRDIKPGNLLVDGLGELWITDFGLARSMRDGDLTMTGELLGTYRYMSPEQALAKRVAMDHRTDVYSLGATLYELLTLEPAFPGDDPHLVMRDIAEKEPVAPRRLNPALPVDLETIVLKAMSKDATGRYATAQEMAEDLGRYLADQPIHARRPSLAAHASKWARRHRGFVTAAFVLLLLGVVALVADKFRVEAEQKRTGAALVKANDNLLLARSAVEKFLVEIGVTNMADQAVPRPARQRLLETALRFYEREFDDPESYGTRVTILHALHRYDDAIALLDRLLVRLPENSWAFMQRGHMLWHQDKNDDALASLDRAIAIEPGRAEAISYKGCVLKDLGRLAEALAEHDRAIVLDPKPAPFHNYRANVLADLGRAKEALEEYEKASKIDPNLPNPHSGRGEVLTTLGRLDDALAAYDRAIAVDPSFAWAYTGRGMTLQALGRLEEALVAHDRAIAIDPGVAKAQTNRGIVLLELGRIEPAIAAHTEAIRLDPRLAQAHVNLSVALLTAGRSDDAMKEADVAIGLAPEKATARFNLGLILAGRNESDGAIREYAEAIRLDANLTVAYVNLGTALAKKGDADGAIENFKKAIEKNHDQAEAWGGLGNSLRDRGDLDGAFKAYTEVVRIRPRYAVGPYCLGTVYAKRGEHANAIAKFREALELDARMSGAHYAIGKSYFDSGNPDAAIEAFDHAILIDPKDADSYYMRGRSYGAKRDLKREIAEYEEAVHVRPEYAEVWSNLGRAYNDCNDPDHAIRALSMAIQIKPDLPEPRLNLGIAYCDKKDPDRAIEQFNEAIRLLAHVDTADFRPRSGRDEHDRNVLALVYNSLGCAFNDKRENAKAVAAYRDAIRIDKNVAPSHYNLAKQLYGSGKDDAESEAEYREAIRLEPDRPEYPCGLGRLLMTQGRYRDALPYLKKGHELASGSQSLTARSAEWIALTEKRVALEDRLDAVVAGKDSPRDERERVEFALLLYAKRRYRESADFYGKALAGDATLAADLANSHRYNAACASVLAAANGAADAADCRGRALEWLRADLDARKRAGLAASLDHWKKDADFQSVRDAVATLPDGERDAWARLWADVDALLARRN
jgi:tetratricopeptide (TPR) repeat protein